MSTVAPAAPSAARAPAAAERPSTVWYWGAAALAFAGVAVAVVWAVVAAVDARNLPDSFARGPASAALVVPVAETGELVVYYEGDDRPTAVELALTVTAPDGAAVAVDPYDDLLEYDVKGRTGKAIATFDANRAGEYRVASTAPAEAGARLAVGEHIFWAFLDDLLPGVVAAGAALLAALALTLVTLRRARARA